MKLRYLILTILVIAILVYFLKPNKLHQNATGADNAYKVFISENLGETYETKIREWATENNQKIQVQSEENNADIIVSKTKISNYKSQEVGKLYLNSYENQGNYEYIRKYDSVYLNFKTNKIDKLVSKYSQNTWNMFAAGDIMLARHVGVKMANLNDYQIPFKYLAKTISQYDVAFANLESPFSETAQPTDTGMVFGAEPKAVEGLKTAGFDVLSLANNHFGNQQNAGMSYTMKLLTQNEIGYTGAGETNKTSCEPKIIDVKGLKIAFLAVDGVDSTPVSYRADDKYPGLCSWQQIALINRGLENAKKTANLTVISMHAGTEYTPKHRADQEDFAHEMIDSGADLIIGSHPHVAQDFEYYKNGLIFYSLGNFVFDQYWSEETQQGLTLNINFDYNQIQSFKINPIAINSNSQPNFAPESVIKEVMTRIGTK